MIPSNKSFVWDAPLRCAAPPIFGVTPIFGVRVKITKI